MKGRARPEFVIGTGLTDVANYHGYYMLTHALPPRLRVELMREISDIYAYYFARVFVNACRQKKIKDDNSVLPAEKSVHTCQKGMRGRVNFTK